MLLQILEEGRLTDNVGRVVDFKNTILILTSNVGAQQIAGGKSYGFQNRKDEEATYSKMKEGLKGELENTFRPEFLNRFDDIIVFRPLTPADLNVIVDIELAKVAKRLLEKGLTLKVNPEAKELLIEKGTNTDFGARPLRRAIEQFLEDPLAEELLKGAFAGKSGITARVAEVEGEKRVVFDTEAAPPAPMELIGAGEEKKS